MWTSTLELDPRRVILTQLLGRLWPGAYFSSLAPLQVQNVPRPPLPAANWVRVRNRLAGICGSDLHLVYVDGDFRIAPAALPGHRFIYPGHEVVGEVIEVGEDVQHLQVGDRVVLHSGPNGITAGVQPLCHACAQGNYSVCEQGELPGPRPVGGGWSEEMLVHEQQLFRVTPDMLDEQAVLLEPAAVALRTALRRLPQPGEHVLIIGAGTIGLLILQVIRALAPQATVSVMARYPFQIEQATRMGAAHILYEQDTYETIAQLTGAKLYRGMLGNKMLLGGYDVIYDTIGSRRTLHHALRWTRAGGAIVLVGVSLHPMHIDLTPLWYQEVSLIGSFGHGMETWPVGTQERLSTFAIAAGLIQQGQIHPEKLITHRFALTNFREALSTASHKGRSRSMKVVFDYALLPASVVPNVRAAGSQRRSFRTTRAWSPGGLGAQREHGEVSREPISEPGEQARVEETEVQPESAASTGTAEVREESQQAPPVEADSAPGDESPTQRVMLKGVAGRPGRSRIKQPPKGAEASPTPTEDIQPPAQTSENQP